MEHKLPSRPIQEKQIILGERGLFFKSKNDHFLLIIITDCILFTVWIIGRFRVVDASGELPIGPNKLQDADQAKSDCWIANLIT